MTHSPSVPDAGGGVSLLALWEGAVALCVAARGDALLRTASPDAPASRSLGERNARLADLHARLFGPGLDLLSECPGCGAVVQFSSDCGQLAVPASGMLPATGAAACHRFAADGYEIRFRMPGSADIASASGAAGVEEFVRRLLGRIVLACTREGCDVPLAQVPLPMREALSRHMETLDPGASVCFALTCPECGAQWDAPLDLGDALWQKVRVAAERVLLDIDVLARAYGWTEQEVLRLSPWRRAAYLQMAAM